MGEREWMRQRVTSRSARANIRDDKTRTHRSRGGNTQGRRVGSAVARDEGTRVQEQREWALSREGGKELNECEILPATNPRGVVRKGNPVSKRKERMYCILKRDSGRKVEDEATSLGVREESKMRGIW